MRDFNKYWSRDFKRITTPPQSTKDWGQVWGAIRGKFKYRTGNKEGCLCTNHQGFVALSAFSHRVRGSEPVFLAELNKGDGITISNEDMRDIAHALRAEAECWFGSARTGLNRLSVLVIDALTDAMVKNRKAVAIVDTTSLSMYGYSPSLRHQKDLRLHEGAHVWQWTINPTNHGLISEEKMISDPEYPVLAREVGELYGNPNLSVRFKYSEAVAWAIAGEGWNVGLHSKARTEGFLERFWTEVKLEYGPEALDLLHLMHPHVRRVFNYVRGRVERNVGRREETTSRAVVESGDGSVTEADKTGGETPGSSRRAEVSQRSLGERRDSGTDDGNDHLRIAFLGRGGFSSGRHRGEQIAIETAPQGDRRLTQPQALEKIAAINPYDTKERRLWPEIGRFAVGLAREAIKGLAPAEEGIVVSTLREISQMKPVNTGDKRLSWKDVTVMAVKRAREAQAAILQQGVNIEKDVAIGAGEAVQRNARAPAKGVSW